MDYRIKITIRNNRILQAIEQQGYGSVSDFCRKFNLCINRTNSIISGKTKPLDYYGNIRPLIENLLDCLHLSVEEAFTEKQLQGFHKNSFQVKMKESQLTSLTSPVQNTELLAMEKDVHNTLKNLMTKILSPREERLVRAYYFEHKNTEELSKELNLSKARIDQIIKKGLFKLSKHYGEFNKSGITEAFPAVGNIPNIIEHENYGRSLVFRKNN